MLLPCGFKQEDESDPVLAMLYSAILRCSSYKPLANFAAYRRHLSTCRVCGPSLTVLFGFYRADQDHQPRLRTFGRCTRFFQAPKRAFLWRCHVQKRARAQLSPKDTGSVLSSPDPCEKGFDIHLCCEAREPFVPILRLRRWLSECPLIRGFYQDYSKINCFEPGLRPMYYMPPSHLGVCRI